MLPWKHINGSSLDNEATASGMSVWAAVDPLTHKSLTSFIEHTSCEPWSVTFNIYKHGGSAKL